MPRNRHKKYPPKEQAQQAPVKPSPAAQALIDQISLGGRKYLMDNLERVLIDSAELAEEPEFAEITLNSEKIVEVTNRWLERFEKRLKDAEKEGPDEHAQVFDDMRIEIIDELATPGFRNLVKNRLQDFRDRCLAENKLEGLEIALILLPALSIKEIPWGICGLVLEIYSRTLDQEMLEVKTQVELYDAITDALKGDLEGIEPDELESMLESPEQFAEVGEKLFAKNPELRELAEKQIDAMIDTFEHDLIQGKVVLDLFSQEELRLPFQRLEEEVGKPVNEWETTPESSERVFDTVKQVIGEIMTPERYQRLRKDIEDTAQAWLQEKKKWAAALNAELDFLDEDGYEDNSFVMAAFFGQIYHLAKEEETSQKHKKRRGR